MSLKRAKGLREGFTTGSAAAAAAKASLLFLLTGERRPIVDIPTPHAGRLSIAIERVDDHGLVSVIKDAGDDPDATHGARIFCRAAFDLLGASGAVSFHAGEGVGLVTLPGLPVPVGEPAVNPGPRKQISKALAEVAAETGFTGAVAVTIGVENGEAIARETMNPRLGIVGGVSILGNSGVVRPYSRASWKAALMEGLDVAKAMRLDTVCFSTGRRSERLLRDHLPHLPEQAFLQAADFFAFSLRMAEKRHFSTIVWACYFGKLVKMAMGLAYTHAKSGDIDFPRLAQWCRRAGVAPTLADLIPSANTARHVFEIIQNDPAAPLFFEAVTQRALENARNHCGDGPALRMYLFDFNGNLLLRQEG